MPASATASPQMDFSPSSELLQDMSPKSPGFFLNPTSAASQFSLGPRQATSALKSQLQKHSSALESTVANPAPQENGVGNHVTLTEGDGVNPSVAADGTTGAGAVDPASVDTNACVGASDGTGGTNVAKPAGHVQPPAKTAASSRGSREASAAAARAVPRRVTRARAAAANANALDAPVDTITAPAAITPSSKGAAPAAAEPPAAEPPAEQPPEVVPEVLDAAVPATQSPADDQNPAPEDTPMIDASQPTEEPIQEVTDAVVPAAAAEQPHQTHAACGDDAQQPAAEAAPETVAAADAAAVPAAEPDTADAVLAAAPADETAADADVVEADEPALPIIAHACGFPAQMPVWPGRRSSAVRRHERLSNHPRSRQFAIWDTYLYTFEAGMPVSEGPCAPGLDELPLYPPVAAAPVVVAPQQQAPQRAQQLLHQTAQNDTASAPQGADVASPSTAPVAAAAAAAAAVSGTSLAPATVQNSSTQPSSQQAAANAELATQHTSLSMPQASISQSSTEQRQQPTAPELTEAVTETAPTAEHFQSVAAQTAPPLPTAETLQTAPHSTPEQRKKIAIRPQMARRLVNTRKVNTSAPAQTPAAATNTAVSAVTQPTAAPPPDVAAAAAPPPDVAAASQAEAAAAAMLQKQGSSVNGFFDAGTPTNRVATMPAAVTKSPADVDMEEAALYDDLEAAHRVTPQKSAAYKDGPSQLDAAAENGCAADRVVAELLGELSSPKCKGRFPESSPLSPSTVRRCEGYSSPPNDVQKAPLSTRSTSPPSAAARRQPSHSPEHSAPRTGGPTRRSPEYHRRGSPRRSQSPAFDAVPRRSSSAVPPSRRGWQRISVLGASKDSNYMAVDENICARIHSNKEAHSCSEFRKTGWCSNAAQCELRHDLGRTRYSLMGYPMRPGEKVRCSLWMLIYANTCSVVLCKMCALQNTKVYILSLASFEVIVKFEFLCAVFFHISSNTCFVVVLYLTSPPLGFPSTP